MSNNGYLKCSCQKCSGHIEFPPAGAGEMVDCPHCGEQTKLVSTSPNHARKTVFIAGSILILFSFAGILIYLSKNTKPDVPVPVNVAQAATKTVIPDDFIQLNDFNIGKIILKKTEGTALVYAVGIVKNETARQRFGVRIRLNLLDAQDNTLGSTSDYIEILEPNKQWQFKALLANPKAVRAKVINIEEQK